jgi:hypothetical protein
MFFADENYSSAIQHPGATVLVPPTTGDTMIKLSSVALATTVAALLLAAPASAQSTAPAAAPGAKSAPAATAPKAKTGSKAERSAVSVECSRQADAKGLHGKERHKFRSTCKKNGGKAM